MELKTLHIFNPEHDLALASWMETYTPPAEIVKLRKENALLPAIFAGDSDFILLPPDSDPDSDPGPRRFEDIARKKNIQIVKPIDLPAVINQISAVEPWGWDPAIRKHLVSNGVPESMLPSLDFICNLRKLSHRKTTIPFREKVADILNQHLINPAKELFSIEEVREFLNLNEKAYFKAPWSSSGRGIVVSDHISLKGLLEWASGVLKKQGSIIAEPAWNRIFDFATEWMIKNGEPEFMGYSVFSTSSRGKYHGNINKSQKELELMIKHSAPEFTEAGLHAQYSVLKEIIAPFYSGPLGIDMLADADGNINYCVEINLRLTMGLINTEKWKKL